MRIGSSAPTPAAAPMRGALQVGRRGVSDARALGGQRALLVLVHLCPDARAVAEMAHAARPAFGKVLLVRLRRLVLRRLFVTDCDPKDLLDHADVVHAHRIVIGQQRTDFDADVAADALLKTILHRLQPTTRHAVRRQILDTLHWTELRALAAWKAQIDIHERHFAWTLLLLRHLLRPRRFGNAFFFETLTNDIDRGGHAPYREPKPAAAQRGKGLAICGRR